MDFLSIENPTIRKQFSSIFQSILLLILHSLSHLGLYQILADLVDVDLGELFELLNSTIRQSFAAWLDYYEDMLEKLSHHLLDTIDYANMETIESEFKNGAISCQNEGAQVIEAMLVITHLT